MNFLQILLLLSIFMFNPFGKRVRTKNASFVEAQSSRAAFDDEEDDEEDDEDDDVDDDSEDEDDEPQAPWGPQQWDAIYSNHMVKRNVRIERSVNPSIRPLVYAQLSRRNWLGIGELDCLCYSDVVKWFYASAIVNGKNSIVAMVRNVQVVVTPKLIAQVIGAPRVHNPNYPIDPKCFEKAKGKKLISKIGMELTNDTQMSFANLAQGDLTQDYRFLHMLITHNFLPVGRASTTSWERGVFMYCVMKGYVIDLPQVIFDYIVSFFTMVRTKEDQLPFGTLISKICILAGVSIDRFEPVTPKEKEIGAKGYKDVQVGQSGASSSRSVPTSAPAPSDNSWMDNRPSLTPMSACANVNDLIGAMSEFKMEQHNVNEYQNRMLMELYRQRGSDHQ